MKKLPLYALLLSLGVFAIGCNSEPEVAPTTTTPATGTDTATPAATDGAADTTNP